MTIAIDVSMLVYAGSGVARYTYDFTVALLKYHPEHSYKLFYSSRRRPSETASMLLSLKKLGARVYDYPFPPWFLKFCWNTHHVLPISWLIGQYDVFHSSDFLRPPLMKSSIGLTTIHDMTWKLFPELHELETIEAHERKVSRTINYGDFILVDSQSTRADLMYLYPTIKPSLVSVLPLGINDRFIPVATNDVTSVLQTYNIQQHTPYFLYVGAIEPRKRLELCVDVFAELVKQVRFSKHTFIIAGRAGWKNEQLFSKIASMGLSKRVLFIGYVDDADLPALYTGASATFYLSQYEGFGLPPLESLVCGTPVLASKNSSIVEFVPKEYISSSTEPRKLAKSISEIVQLKSTKSLIDLEQFSWRKYSDDFIELTSSIVEN